MLVNSIINADWNNLHSLLNVLRRLWCFSSANVDRNFRVIRLAARIPNSDNGGRLVFVKDVREDAAAADDWMFWLIFLLVITLVKWSTSRKVNILFVSTADVGPLTEVLKQDNGERLGQLAGVCGWDCAVTVWIRRK